MIRLRDILDEVILLKSGKVVPDFLYHATYRALLPRIKKNGIICGGGKYRNFVNTERGVYLGYDAEYAGSMVEASENDDIPEDWVDEIIVLKVDVSKLDISKLDIDPNVILSDEDDMIYSYIYRDNIPYNFVLGVTRYS